MDLKRECAILVVKRIENASLIISLLFPSYHGNPEGNQSRERLYDEGGGDFTNDFTDEYKVKGYKVLLFLSAPDKDRDKRRERALRTYLLDMTVIKFLPSSPLKALSSIREILLDSRSSELIRGSSLNT